MITITNGDFQDLSGNLLPKGSAVFELNVDAVFQAGIQNIRVQISASEIKNAFTTPITLISAPGPGLIIAVLNSVQQFNPVTTPYSQDPGVSMGLGTTPAAIEAGFMLFTEIDFTGTAADFAMVQLEDSVPNTSLDPSVYVNAPFSWVDSVDLSADSGDGTVTLNLQYVVIDVSTGAIVGGTGNNIHGSMVVCSTAMLAAALGNFPSNATPVTLVPAPPANCAICPLNQITVSGYTSSKMTGQGPFTGLGFSWNDAYNNNAVSSSPFDDNVNNAEIDGPVSWESGTVTVPPIAAPLLMGIIGGSGTVGDSFCTVYTQYCIVNLLTGDLIPAGVGGGDLAPGFAALSAAQINAAFTTPQPLVPAGGANTIQAPLCSVTSSIFHTIPYSAGSGGTPNPVIGLGPTSSIITTQDLMSVETAPLLFTLSANQVFITAPIVCRQPLTQLANVPISWADYNNLAGNTANSTAAVSVPFITIDLTTGNITSSPSGIVLANIPAGPFSITNGTLDPGAEIWPNSALSPVCPLLGSWYYMTLFDENGARLSRAGLKWQFEDADGTTVDVSNKAPFG